MKEKGRVSSSYRHVHRRLSVDLKGVPGAKEALSLQKGMLADGDLQATTGQVKRKRESECVCEISRWDRVQRACKLFDELYFCRLVMKQTIR